MALKFVSTHQKIKDYGGVPEERGSSVTSSKLMKEEMEEIKQQILKDNPDLTYSDLTDDADYYADYMDGGE